MVISGANPNPNPNLTVLFLPSTGIITPSCTAPGNGGNAHFWASTETEYEEVVNEESEASLAAWLSLVEGTPFKQLPVDECIAVVRGAQASEG